MDFLATDLSKEDEQGHVIYKRLLVNGYKERDTSPGALVLMQVPPFAEQYFQFILTNSSKHNFNKHLGWMLEKLDISSNSICEYMIVDLVRYVLLCTENVHSSTSGEKVHRWYLLGWLLKYCKSEVFKMLLKQALFWDWIFYKGEPGWYRVFEPSWLLIINSINKYKDMSEELIDYLFLFVKEFDSADPLVEQNLMRVFEMFKNRNVTS